MRPYFPRHSSSVRLSNRLHKSERIPYLISFAIWKVRGDSTCPLLRLAGGSDGGTTFLFCIFAMKSAIGERSELSLPPSNCPADFFIDISNYLWIPRLVRRVASSLGLFSEEALLSCVGTRSGRDSFCSAKCHSELLESISTSLP